ncbi:MAG: hypothetical protein RL095_3458 [Verrucomicrobiota bacterium]|jgi:pimeloyl-ACP methyl ester carboxylesterase/lysophospholipase L1-like esterase
MLATLLILQLFTSESPAPPVPAVLARSASASGLSFPGEKIDQWQGGKRHVFQFQGHQAWVVEPAKPLPGNPWTWCTEFPNAFTARTGVPQLIAAGFHHVHIDDFNNLGCPAQLKLMSDFHDELVRRGLAPKAAMIGLSRGGFMAYRYALQNPSRIACIYADAPVCDMKSWPGGKGKGKGSPADWKRFMELYGFKTEAEALAFDGNVLEEKNLKALAEAKIPLLHHVGDADDVVPVAENTAILEQRYKALGGSIEVIHAPGVGHHPHGFDDPKPAVDFILKHAAPATASSAALTPEALSGKRVLVLGDSITQDGRWLGNLETLLRQARPQLDFDFIGLGLASETLSGLSEPGHAGGQFPRPCLFSRLERALAEAKPQVVVACYGMNDGIYLPFEESRFAAFKDGVTRLAASCDKAGARLVLVTPPIHEGDGVYEEVLARYSRWEVENPPASASVIDLHSAMAAEHRQRQQGDAKFRFSKDNVHPGDLGHLVMARSLAKALGVATPGSAEEQLATFKECPLHKLVEVRRKSRSAAWLAWVGFDREKHVPPRTGDLQGAEAQAAEALAKIRKMQQR